MARQFDPQELITLPSLDAASTVSLASALGTSAREEKSLPRTIEKALAALDDGQRTLRDVIAGRLRPNGEGALARAADLRVDTAWSGFHDWSSGWAKLPVEMAPGARELYEAVFPDGLKFTRLPFRQQWSEGEARLDAIARDHAETVRRLGGDAVLANVRAAHAAYGDALGITRVKTEPVGQPSVREALDTTLAAMRTYVLRVAAHADPDEPATVRPAERLLAPLASWPVRGRDTEGTGEAPTPSPTTTPTAPPATSPSTPT
jgi:hypothetical protein